MILENVYVIEKNFFIGLSYSIQVAMVTSALITPVLLIFIVLCEYFSSIINMSFSPAKTLDKIWSSWLYRCPSHYRNGSSFFICLKGHPMRPCRKTPQDLSVLNSELQTVLLYSSSGFIQEQPCHSHRCDAPNID